MRISRPRTEKVTPTPGLALLGPRLESPSPAYPSQKPKLVKEFERAVQSGAVLFELHEDFLVVTLTGVHGTDRVSLTWKPLPSCTPGGGGQTLIAFAVPNPNPASDLTILQTWADDQARGQPASVPPGLCVAWGHLSSSQEGLQSQDPVSAWVWPLASTHKPSASSMVTFFLDRREVPGNLWTLRWTATVLTQEAARWAKCQESPGCTASSVSSLQHMLQVPVTSGKRRQEKGLC